MSCERAGRLHWRSSGALGEPGSRENKPVEGQVSRNSYDREEGHYQQGLVFRHEEFGLYHGSSTISV